MREITEEVGGGGQIRFQSNALEALQEAAEAYLVNEFERKYPNSITVKFLQLY